MKVEKWLHVSIDGAETDAIRLDIYLSAKDIETLHIEAPDSVGAALNSLNNLAGLLRGIPDVTITEMNDAQRETIATFLHEQAARYVPQSTTVVEQ